MADTPQIEIPISDLASVLQVIDSHPQKTIIVGAPPAGDSTLPVVSNFIPPPGSTISIDPNDSIQFDVTDDSGSFARVIVTVTMAGVMEVVHDGSQFKGLFAGTSLRSLITNGFRFNVARQGGWTSAPTFEVFALDKAGNEAA